MGRFCHTSNYGNPPIEYGSPGVNISSLWRNGGTNTIDGTSMAAPHIAGLLLGSPQGIATDGYVSNDPDGDADPIAVAATLTLSISGPVAVESGQYATWSADP